MVSIHGDEFVTDLNTAGTQPQLKLVDFTLTRARTRSSRRREAKLENRLFVITLVAVLLFFTVSGVTSILNLGSRLAAASQLSAPPTRTIIVTPGDTLWQIASKYGDPNVYILDRIEQLTRINHMADDQSLVSGEKILVPIWQKSSY